MAANPRFSLAPWTPRPNSNLKNRYCSWMEEIQFALILSLHETPTADTLFFVEGAPSWRSRSNPTSLAFTGEAVTIAEDAANSTASPDMLIFRDPASAGRTQLAWFDRKGNRIGEVGEAAPQQYGINLSPDGTRVVIDAGGSERHVSVVEFEGGRSTRFTTGSTTGTPIWSPNGNQMLFHSARNGGREVFVKASTGAGDEELFFNEFPAYAHDWSKDGRYILLTGFFVGKGADIWVLPTEPGSKPRPYVATTVYEIQAKFSPEPGGPHWVAYMSDESGQPEVYVSSFPDPSKGKFPISKGGGHQPRWSRDGKEIFYISQDNSLMSVAVNAVAGKDGPVFKAGPPNPLFKTALTRDTGAVTYSWVWDAAPDGRFLLNTVVEQPAQAAVTAIINWQAALRKR
jgi:Tol biopolymer transport system component